MNVMTDQQRQSVTDTALIEMMTEYGYWDHDIGTDGISMETFLRNCFANEGITDIGELDKKCMEYATDPKGDNSLKILCSAYANNEKFRNTVILDADENNGAVVTRTTVYNETTEKDEHTYTVAFCGTRKGYDEWPDNAEGLLNESSAAQRSAANYFDMVSSHFDEDANVVVTGHSKGGNKAQYVTMFASNRELIDSCVALDGQGFSKQAMDAMQKHADYEAQRDKITLVCGSDDYVHVLGERLAKKDQTYYIEGDHRVVNDGFEAYVNDHLAQRLFCNQDGIFTCELKPASEQGTLSKFAEVMFNRAYEGLPPDTFAEVAHELMNWLDGNFTLEGALKVYAKAGLLLESILVYTPEGQAFMQTLPYEFTSNASQNIFHGYDVVGAGYFLVLLLQGISVPVTGFSHVLKYVVDPIKHVVDSNKFDLWLHYGIGSDPYTTTGTNIADANTLLKVDTIVLSDCAAQLSGLQSKVNDIKERLISAYKREQVRQATIYEKDHIQQIGAYGFVPIKQNEGDLFTATTLLSKTAKGMGVVSSALGSMSGFLEDAEAAATKYGSLGG